MMLLTVTDFAGGVAGLAESPSGADRRTQRHTTRPFLTRCSGTPAVFSHVQPGCCNMQAYSGMNNPSSAHAAAERINPGWWGYTGVSGEPTHLHLLFFLHLQLYIHYAPTLQAGPWWTLSPHASLFWHRIVLASWRGVVSRVDEQYQR